MFHTAKSFAHESMSHLGSIFLFIAFVFQIGLKLHIYFSTTVYNLGSFTIQSILMPLFSFL